MSTAGIGGEITGKGCQVVIIDDPVKNAEEANSAVIREKTGIGTPARFTRGSSPAAASSLFRRRGTKRICREKSRSMQKPPEKTGESFECRPCPKGQDVDPLRRPEGDPHSGRTDTGPLALERISGPRVPTGSALCIQCRPQPATAANSSGPGSDTGGQQTGILIYSTDRPGSGATRRLEALPVFSDGRPGVQSEKRGRLHSHRSLGRHSASGPDPARSAPRAAGRPGPAAADQDGFTAGTMLSMSVSKRSQPRPWSCRLPGRPA